MASEGDEIGVARGVMCGGEVRKTLGDVCEVKCEAVGGVGRWGCRR